MHHISGILRWEFSSLHFDRQYIFSITYKISSRKRRSLAGFGDCKPHDASRASYFSHQAKMPGIRWWFFTLAILSWFSNLRIVKRLRLPVSLFKWVESLKMVWTKTISRREKILLPEFIWGDKVNPLCVLRLLGPQCLVPWILIQ